MCVGPGPLWTQITSCANFPKLNQCQAATHGTQLSGKIFAVQSFVPTTSRIIKEHKVIAVGKSRHGPTNHFCLFRQSFSGGFDALGDGTSVTKIPKLIVGLSAALQPLKQKTGYKPLPNTTQHTTHYTTRHNRAGALSRNNVLHWT